jgi:serine/threonine-protein kinase
VPKAVSGLIALAFLTGLLAMYQWLELIRSIDGVEAFCAIGEGFDCTRVWGSTFAKAIHRWTSVPLAGWGLVWSVAALVSALAVGQARMEGRRSEAAVAAVRWVGAGGAVACVVFFLVSVSLGTLCLTCVTTYVLVAIYAVLAFRLPASSLLPLVGIRIPALAALAAYLLLLFPGRQTPVTSDAALEDAIQKIRDEQRAGASTSDRPQRAKSNPPAKPEPPATPLGRFLRELPGPARRAVVDALETYRAADPVSGARFGERPMTGPRDAPVQIVDFVDVQCPHCAHLLETLGQIRRELSGVPFSTQTRYFPLDGACNDVLPRSSGDPLSVRCLAPKLLICAQGNPKYQELKHQVFERHASLTVDALYQWAGEMLGSTRAGLERCVRSKQTEAKLAEDVSFAKRFDPRGTPLVVVNGREVPPLPPFLYAIILAGGDPKAKGFEELGF